MCFVSQIIIILAKTVLLQLSRELKGIDWTGWLILLRKVTTRTDIWITNDECGFILSDPWDCLVCLHLHVNMKRSHSICSPYQQLPPYDNMWTLADNFTVCFSSALNCKMLQTVPCSNSCICFKLKCSVCLTLAFRSLGLFWRNVLVFERKGGFHKLRVISNILFWMTICIRKLNTFH